MLRLLIIGDIHGETNAVINVLSDSDKSLLNGIVITGDIGSEILEGSSRTDETLQKLYRISVQAILELAATVGIPVYFVPGNRDLPNLETSLREVANIDCLHEPSVKSLEDFTLAGVGGSNWINGQFPYEWQEEETYNRLKNILVQNPFKHLILVSHCPPLGSRLDLIGGTQQRGGSSAIRRLITEFHPLVCVSGHIHESAGVDIVGNTLCLNAGSILTPRPITYTGADRTPVHSFALAEQCFLIEIHDAHRPLISVHHLLELPHANVDARIISYLFADGQLSKLGDQLVRNAYKNMTVLIKKLNSPPQDI